MRSVVGDLAVLERDVEVGAHENALARDVRLADGPRKVHAFAATGAGASFCDIRSTRSDSRQL